MRLWTLHPRHLDGRGLVTLWREALLAQAVLRGRTRGYQAHPQLDRFRWSGRPVAAIGSYLTAVCDEAERRGYAFDRRRIGRARLPGQLQATSGQMHLERLHLLAKLRRRAPANGRALAKTLQLDAHPLFRVVRGGVEPWERATAVSLYAQRRSSS